MTLNAKFKNMETKEMAKCEGCGEYHPIEDCEVVTIRIVKGKHCDLKPQEKVVYRDAVTPAITTVSIEQQKVENNPVPQDAKPRRNIMPPGVMGLMIPPTHPMHEQYGAKETRHV